MYIRGGVQAGTPQSRTWAWGVIAATAKGPRPPPCPEGSHSRALPPKEELIIRNTHPSANAGAPASVDPEPPSVGR